MDLPTTFFGWVAFLAEKYAGDFMRGLGVTLELAIIGTLLGCLLGFIVGIIRSLVVDPGASSASRVLTAIFKTLLRPWIMTPRCK